MLQADSIYLLLRNYLQLLNQYFQYQSINTRSIPRGVARGGGDRGFGPGRRDFGGAKSKKKFTLDILRLASQPKKKQKGHEAQKNRKFFWKKGANFVFGPWRRIPLIRPCIQVRSQWFWRLGQKVPPCREICALSSKYKF